MNTIPHEPARVPPPVKRRPAFSPMVLSALVYPGAGQFMQRRWVAGAVVSTLFTLPSVWFFVEVFGVLKAYYEFAFNFGGATGQAPSVGSIVMPFSLSALVYVAGLVDTAIASYRQRIGAKN